MSFQERIYKLTDRNPELNEKGRSADVKILDLRFVAKGANGRIFEAKTEVAGKPADFILKRFFRKLLDEQTWEEKTAEEKAGYSESMYRLCKKNKIKVWRTYRLREGTSDVLMTNGNLGEQVCVGSPQTLKEYGYEKMPKIEDFDNFLKQYFDHAIVANNKKIFLHADAYLFFIDRQTLTKLDFIVGDYDGIEDLSQPPKYDFDFSVTNAIEHASYALTNLVQKNVADEKIPAYVQQINDYKEYLKKNIPQ